MSWFDDILSGQPLGTTDKLQAESDALDSQLAALNQQQLNAGTITQTQYDQMQQNLQSGKVDVAGETQQAFIEGAQEGAQAELNAVTQVTSGITGVVGNVLWSFIKGIPWWLWFAGAGALFVWLGGLELLQGSLKRFKK